MENDKSKLNQKVQNVIPICNRMAEISIFLKLPMTTW